MRFYYCTIITYIFLDKSNLVCSTVCRIEMKSANSTVSCSSFDLYITILSKTCSPGILDEPVILSFLGIMTISYHCYFMIQVILAAWVSVLFAASAVIVNTVMIVIYMISLNCCGDWIDINHIFHFLFCSVPLVILTGHMSTTIVPTVIVPASFFLSFIWAAALSLHSSSIVLDYPVKVGRRPGTVAPEGPPCTAVVIEVVIVGTVHKVLLREVVIHGVGLLLEASVNHSHRGKGCARAAVFLILDRGNSTLSNPAPFSRSLSPHLIELLHKCRILNILKLCCDIIRWHAKSTSDDELLLSKIIKFCHLPRPGYFSCLVASIVLHHVLVVLHEDFSSHGELLGVDIILPKLFSKV